MEMNRNGMCVFRKCILFNLYLCCRIGFINSGFYRMPSARKFPFLLLTFEPYLSFFPSLSICFRGLHADYIFFRNFFPPETWLLLLLHLTWLYLIVCAIFRRIPVLPRRFSPCCIADRAFFQQKWIQSPGRIKTQDVGQMSWKVMHASTIGSSFC